MKQFQITFLLTLFALTLTGYAQQSTSVCILVSRSCAVENFHSPQCKASLDNAVNYALDAPEKEVRAAVKVLNDLYDEIESHPQSITREVADRIFNALREINEKDKLLHPTPEQVAGLAIHDQCGDGNRDSMTREQRLRFSIREQISSLRKLLPEFPDETERGRVAAYLKTLDEMYADVTSKPK
ncbi:MAG: hypothetical protein QOH63_1946 [Acidobacteriota bacterium]|jgi:hypothetical protein|nr:hypothetical protein [Acidobacteriota bacterium]